MNNYKVDENRNDFTVGKACVVKPAVTVVCKSCGTDKLQVGIQFDFVVIKCPHCGWEEVIHG